MDRAHRLFLNRNPRIAEEPVEITWRFEALCVQTFGVGSDFVRAAFRRGREFIPAAASLQPAVSINRVTIGRGILPLAIRSAVKASSFSCSFTSHSPVDRGSPCRLITEDASFTRLPVGRKNDLDKCSY